eukprot:3686512-Alexandrium_andersonii.AAC.1
MARPLVRSARRATAEGHRRRGQRSQPCERRGAPVGHRQGDRTPARSHRSGGPSGAARTDGGRAV